MENLNKNNRSFPNCVSYFGESMNMMKNGNKKVYPINKTNANCGSEKR